MSRRSVFIRLLTITLLACFFPSQQGMAQSKEHGSPAPQSADDKNEVEVKEITNYVLSDFKFGDKPDGDFMLGNFKGEEVFAGALAKTYPGVIQVRVKLRQARVVDVYLTHKARRISTPVTPSIERALLRRPEWNRGPECVPRRQVYTVKRRIRKQVRLCQVILIVPRNCPARVASMVCYTPRNARARKR
jgi:hypothetical protein